MKRPGWAGWLVPLLLAMLFVLFRQQVGRFAISQGLSVTGKFLHARVEHGRVDGDPFGSPQVHQLKVVLAQDSVTVERFHLSYNPFGLLRGRFSFPRVDIEGPCLYLSSHRPRPDGPDMTAPRRKPMTRFPRIAVGHLKLDRGRVFIDTVLRVDSLNLRLWLVSGGTNLRAGLSQAEAWLAAEQVGLRSLTAGVRMTSDSLNLERFELATRRSRARGGLRLALDGSGISARLESLAVSLGEFTDLPGEFRASGTASLDAGVAAAVLRYSAGGLQWRELELPQIDGRLFLADSVLRLQAAGTSADMGGFNLDSRLDLRDSTFRGRLVLEQVAMHAVEKSLPDYRVDVAAEFGGRGIDSIGLEAGAKVAAAGVDSLVVHGCYRRGRVLLSILDVRGPVGRLRASGSYAGRTLDARLSIEEFDLAELGALLGTPLAGKIQGEFTASRRGDSWNMVGGLVGTGLAGAGVKAGAAAVQVDVGFGREMHGRLAVGAESLAAAGLQGDAQFLWSGPEFELRFDLPSNRLRATGEIVLSLARVDATVAMLEFATEQETLATTRPFTVNWQRDSLQVRGFATTISGGTVELDLAASAGASLPDVSLSVRQLELAKLARLAGLGLQISGRLDLDVRGSDTLLLGLQGSDVRVPSIEMGLADLRLSLAATRSGVRVDYLKFCRTPDSGTVAETSTVTGMVGYNLQAKPFADSLQFDLRADLRDPGVWVLGFLEEIIDIRQGQIHGLLSLAGRLAEPSLDGRVRIARAHLVVPSINTGVERVNAELVLVKNKIRFEKFSGRSSRGTVVGAGFVDLGNSLMVDTLHFGISFTGLTFNPQPEIFAIADGDVNLDLAEGRPFSLSGTVDVSEALLAFGFGHAATPAGSGSGPDTAFVYDVRVRGERGIWLRNSLLDIELAVDLNVRKTLTEEVFSGELSSRQGYVYYLDHTLRVSRGLIRFPNINQLNPGLDILAELPVRSARDSTAAMPEKVVLAVTGTLEQPRLDFSSDPSGWDAAEIASYLNFNATPGELSSMDQQQAMSKLLSQRLLGYFQTQVAKRARGFVNLDYLAVETDWAGGEGNRVTVGKYVGRNLYVSYTQNFTGDVQPVFRAEYYLNRKNELVAERDELGRISLRYRLKLRY